jgi:hypothetical protein
VGTAMHATYSWSYSLRVELGLALASATSSTQNAGKLTRNNRYTEAEMIHTSKKICLKKMNPENKI